MPDLTYDPPLPPRAAPDGFTQTIRLIESDRPIGIARWHVPGDGADGVAQLIELSISPPHGRKGHGKKFIDAVVAQASAYLRSRKTRLRRMWIAVEQKRQVVGRSFLTARGFHHITTMKDLLVDQDVLIYMKGFD